MLILAVSGRISLTGVMHIHFTAAAKMILYRAERGSFSRNPQNGEVMWKYFLIFLLVLAIFVISVTLGAQNDQVVTFNYLLAQGEFRISTLFAVLLPLVLLSAG